MQVVTSYDSRYNCLHSIVVVDNYIVYNISYNSVKSLPNNDVVRLYDECLEERRK